MGSHTKQGDRQRPPLALLYVDGGTVRAAGGVPVSNVLIRGVDPATLARIDAAAQRTGQSRNVLLRELSARYADEQESGTLTDQQVEAFGSSVRDLPEPATRAAAGRR